MEDIYNPEDFATASATSNNNNNHGWQKVTYAKKRKNQQNGKQKSSGAAVNGGSTEEKNGNVFSAIEQQSEDRHRRIVEAQKKSDSEFESMYGNKASGGRSKKRGGGGGGDYESGDDDVEERENGNVVEDGKKVEKKKKTKAEKKPKVTVAEAAAKIDSEILAAFLVDITATYENQEDIQLMRFADFFGRAFSGVAAAQFPWVKTFKESPVAKIVEIPLSHIPEAVYKTSVDWLNQHSVTALSSFALLLLDSIVADLGNQLPSVKNKKASVQPSTKSQVAFFVVLAMVLRRKPDALLSLLPTLRENSKYQGQDKLPVIAWMISQASQGDLAVGLCAWAHNLLPLLNSKSTNNPLNRDLILQLVERMLAVPKARSILINGAARKGERLVPPTQLEILMRVTFPVSSARVKATERFEAVYPILKDVALAGVPTSKAMKQVFLQAFGFAITAAGEGNSELAKEATNVILRCLAQNSDIYKHWDKIYLDNLGASVAILKKLSEQIREQQVDQSSVPTVKQTMISFQQKNEEALAGGDVSQKALLKDADKYAKAILGRLSSSHGCLKAFAVVVIALAAGAVVMSTNPDTSDYWNKVTVMLSSFQSA